MEFQILGPLVVRSGDREVAISAPRQRVILTTLLLNPNQVVSVDRIAQFVWDHPLPPSAAATVRTYVMRLRRALGSFGEEPIQTRTPGYLVRIQENDTDLGRFLARRRAAKGLAESGDLAAAVEELDRGLGLWRSEPFVDVPCARLHEREGGHLRELRLQTLGWRMDMQLELGRHTEVLPELWRIVREQPLNEAFVGRLMLALFRSGQQPEALALFQHVRNELIGQFAMEPGAQLREIQRRILCGEDNSVAIGAPCATDPAEIPMPAQLPPQVRDFAGRSVEIRELRELLTAEDDTQPVACGVVTGPAGVGKTSLLLRVAHAVSGDYPDGQLYASLENSQGATVDPASVAMRFLIGLGVSPSVIPDADPDRLDLYRSVIARRRILIVLDDACDASGVRALMPGSGSSRMLVGSRRRLADLDASSTIVLDSLDEQNSMKLLAGMIGRQRIDAEIDSARMVVAVCSGLPLALRVVGLRLLDRPDRRICDIARKLVDSDQFLDELQVGDVAVRSALGRAYDALNQRSRGEKDLRKAFRWLGVIVGHGIRPRAVAVLLECSESLAEELLEDLADLHLVRGQGGGQYVMDHSSWVFACERLYQEELSGCYVAALQRLNRHGYPTELPFAPCGERSSDTRIIVTEVPDPSGAELLGSSDRSQ
ncbi:AfsR/SARP family transcriptional regulator [Nocardia sp. CNY236]|uniref:AfsR/SARP family transcriptional regulator n=1 Tax=Nocardia sp. CNY236 TaxID=1169152 RepID=UPI000424EB38|nr:AfsR/SARP family transcriptional regulator [Nocardia sp. CNY236]